MYKLCLGFVSLLFIIFPIYTGDPQLSFLFIGLVFLSCAININDAQVIKNNNYQNNAGKPNNRVGTQYGISTAMLPPVYENVHPIKTARRINTDNVMRSAPKLKHNPKPIKTLPSTEEHNKNPYMLLTNVHKIH
jgi:hypothetical protein